MHNNINNITNTRAQTRQCIGNQKKNVIHLYVYFVKIPTAPHSKTDESLLVELNESVKNPVCSIQHTQKQAINLHSGVFHWRQTKHYQISLPRDWDKMLFWKVFWIWLNMTIRYFRHFNRKQFADNRSNLWKLSLKDITRIMYGHNSFLSWYNFMGVF